MDMWQIIVAAGGTVLLVMATVGVPMVAHYVTLASQVAVIESKQDDFKNRFETQMVQGSGKFESLGKDISEIKQCLIRLETQFNERSRK